MKKCKNCSVENAQENQFCENCGAEIEKCPVCDRPHEIKIFCPCAGKNIKEFLEERENSEKKWEADKKFREFYKKLAWIFYLRNIIVATTILLLLIIMARSIYFLLALEKHPLLTALCVLIMAISFSAIMIHLTEESISKAFPKKYKEYKEKFAEKFPDDAKWLE